MKNSKLLKRFVPYYRNYWWIMLIDLLCATLTIVCEVIFPLLVKDITDRAIANIANLTVQYILIIGAIYLGLRIVDTASNYYMQYIGHYMGSKIEADMRREMFAHLQQMSHKYYNETKIGQLMSRITTDLFDVTEFAHHCPEEFYIAGLKIIVSFAILCTFNVYMTLIIFAMIPIMLIFSTYFSKKMHAAFRAQRKSLGEINFQVEDSLLGIRVVKSFANESVEQEKFERGNKAFLKVRKTMYKAMSGFHSVTRFFDGLMYIVVVIAGGLFLAYGMLGIGEFSASLLFVSTLLQSVRRLVEFTEQFGRGMTGVERFFEIIDTPPEIVDNDGAIELSNVNGDITIRDLTFGYGDDDTKVFHNLNLEIPAGKNIALIGASGSGKTTLSNLIPRFFEVESGEILIDGVDIRNIKLKSLREHIGIVQQDVYMFSGTIRENIAYGKPNATDEEIKQAAKASGADEFIESLPKGYNTFVGERGVKLSGGQKQRISIARVFLKNPPILILDEATSALDNESERLVQKSLEKLSAGRTSIIIAHRLSTIRNADEIIVLDSDGIVERGTHDELITKGGIYYKMLNV